jgi:MFS superfamily sulfate permease-like transporter
MQQQQDRRRQRRLRLFFIPFLNVPALCKSFLTAFVLVLFHSLVVAVSLGEQVDTNKELVAHGYSNLLAGVLETLSVPIPPSPLVFGRLNDVF